MTFLQKNLNKIFYCLSTDTKPTNNSVYEGCVAEELDTGIIYYYSGSAWVAVNRVADKKVRVSSTQYTFDIVKGNIANHTAWSKIGYNGAVGATEEEMWPVSTAYTWPTSELTMTIVSDSVEDDPVKADTNPGTGAYTVDVYYLDDAFAEKTVTVTLNGTSAVNIATDMYRLQNARIATTGTGLVPAGNITIAQGGTTYGYISAGRTRMRQCTWTVPAGKTLYITGIAFSCSDQAASKYCRFTTKANYDNKSGGDIAEGSFSSIHRSNIE